MYAILFITLLVTSALTIDTGCRHSEPVFCKFNALNGRPVCAKTAVDCDGFEGCTSPDAPYLCSDGTCVRNYTMCMRHKSSCDNER